MQKWTLVLTILLAACGLWVDYESSQIGFVAKEISILEKGQVTTKEVLQRPAKGTLLGVASVFLYTLAASVFVSGMITFRIEELDRKAQAQRMIDLAEGVNKDVFESVFKTLVPGEIFAAVRDGIIRNPIVRRDANFIFDFSVSGGKVHLRQTFKYEMHNLGSEPFENPVYMVQDDSAEEDYLERAVFSINGVVVEEFDRGRGGQSEKLIVNQRSPHEKEGRIYVAVPPRSSMDVTLVFRMVFASVAHVQDAFFTEYPIINAALVVNHPKEFHFRIFQAMSTEMKCTLDEAERKIFEARGGILPLQGFSFTLSPKGEASTEPRQGNST